MVDKNGVLYFRVVAKRGLFCMGGVNAAIVGWILRKSTALVEGEFVELMCYL